jgi:polysaccharide biosynthesis protein PslH
MDDNRLLVIAGLGCGPPYAGNRMRMRSLLEECRGLGYTIHFAGINFSDEERTATLPRVDQWVADFQWPTGMESRALMPRIQRRIQRRLALGFRNPTDWIDRWMHLPWIAQARQLQKTGRYRRVLVAYVFYSAFLEAFGSECKRIIDTHDVFSDRRQRLEAIGVDGNWFSVPPSEERRGLLRADAVLAIQSTEASTFRDLLRGRRPVHEVGHFLPIHQAKNIGKPLPAERIGFVASANPLNVDGVRWFLATVWPNVVSRCPQAKFFIAGQICDHFQDAADSVELLGKVEDLADFYGRCVCTVNPMRTGTGLKIKTLESLAHGCSVVTSPSGAEGLECCRDHGLRVASDPHQFADNLVRWITNPGEAAEAGKSAQQILLDLYSQWRKALAESLECHQ